MNGSAKLGPMSSPKSTLVTRLQEATGLSETQQRIRACLLTHAEEAALWGVEDLAQESGTCVATVVRFAKRLGYSGYLEMRKSLVTSVRKQYRRGEQLLQAPARASQTLVEVVHRDMKNLDQVLQSVDDARLQKAVDLLKGSRLRLAIGDGVSALMTRQLAYLLLNTGLAVLEGNPADFATQVSVLGAEDLLIAISITPYTRETLDAAAYAHKRGVPVLVFTDNLHTPLAKAATLALPIPGKNLLFSHSLVAFSALTYALATAIAREHPEDALQKLEEVERVARSKFTGL